MTLGSETMPNVRVGLGLRLCGGWPSSSEQRRRPGEPFRCLMAAPEGDLGSLSAWGTVLGSEDCGSGVFMPFPEGLLTGAEKPKQPSSGKRRSCIHPIARGLEEPPVWTVVA